MDETVPKILRSLPGIKRDGTKFDGDFYTDGQWVRFQRGLPRKIRGYRSTQKFLTELSKGMSVYTRNNQTYFHSGGTSKLERFLMDKTLNSSVIFDRTPVGLAANENNRWMFDYQYDSSGSNNAIIAHVAPNGDCICNDQGGAIYIGDAFGTAPLTSVSLPVGANATGGIVSLHPYLFYYGTDGIIGHSVAGEPSDLTGAGSNLSRPWSQKIIKAKPLRAGSGSGPAGIFWAFDAVIRATFVGGSTIFNYDVLSTESSILSADSVIDYDGVFYWCGLDRFMMFNGVVREVDNQMNMNYFFDNVNKNHSAKVFAFKVPRFGEIWWCYPRGDATECSHAIIYNVREGSWYDTELPNQGRSAGVYSNGLLSPVTCGIETASTGFKIWVHEQGLDEIDGQFTRPVRSFYETADQSQLTSGVDQVLRLARIEPDFVQSGPMTVQVVGRANARAPEVLGNTYSFPELASNVSDQTVTMRDQRRELRVRFESNTLGGDYQMGQIIGHFGPGDGTKL